SSPVKSGNASIHRSAPPCVRRNPRRAKTNLPPANLRSATNVPPPRSPLFFVTEGSNRFGKIGSKLSAAHEDCSQRRICRHQRNENDRGADPPLPIAAAINFSGAQWPRRASARMV